MYTDLKPAIILLVEDDPGDQEITRRALEEGHVPHRLFIAEDGEAAMDYLHNRGFFDDPLLFPRPDLILLDLNLPKMDGRQVLEQIRADAALCRLPVVMFSTSRNEEDVARAYELGVNSYICKPSGVEELQHAITALQAYWFQVVLLPPPGAPR